MELKCPFAAPITSGRAACVNAHEVVRRGGSEYDCALAPAHAQCSAIHGRLKSVGLAAFDVEDDLTSMPHSVLVKIQGGGLAGLQRLLGEDAPTIDDVHALVERSLDALGGLDEIPFEQLGDDMTGYKLERRTRRRR
jgi:hypothetical protein